MVEELATYRLEERPHALVAGSEDSMNRYEGLRSLPLELADGVVAVGDEVSAS